MVPQKEGPGFNAGGKKRQLWGPSGDAEGFTVGASNAGQNEGWVGIKDERRGRGSVRRDGAGALMGVKRQGLEFARRETKQGLQSRGAKG